MWLQVYLAQDKEAASEIKAELERFGIVTKLRRFSGNEDKAVGSYEILVTGSDVEKAHDIIIEKGMVV